MKPTIDPFVRAVEKTFSPNVKSRGKPAPTVRAVGVRMALIFLIGLAASALQAQPSFTGSAPMPMVMEDAAERRAAYLARAQEAVVWRAGLGKPDTPATLGLAEIAA